MATRNVGDYLVLGGTRLAVVVATGERQGAASGVRVMDGGAYSRFVQDGIGQAAVVGETVCEHPRGSHFCGRFHADARDLETLRKLQAEAA